MNLAIILGRLTRDPELRHTQSGTPVASFTVAVDNGRDKNGEKREATFIDCVAWSATGETITKWFVKGQPIAVQGRLNVRKWVDNDNNNRRAVEVVVSTFDFAGDAPGGRKPRDKPDGFAGGEYDSSDEPPGRSPYSELDGEVDDGEFPL
jgi:single-strand DNA-binding protein